MGLYRPRKFPAGGWVWHDTPFRMQRTDQGQDFEIPHGGSIVAPGWGQCLMYAHDGPFPNGFGDPYMVVKIHSGRFAGNDWYLGHMNYVQIRPGEWFHEGRKLGRLYNSLNPGWGWVEIGHWNGGPGPNGTGAKYHNLFNDLWRWST